MTYKLHFIYGRFGKFFRDIRDRNVYINLLAKQPNRFWESVHKYSKTLPDLTLADHGYVLNTPRWFAGWLLFLDCSLEICFLPLALSDFIISNLLKSHINFCLKLTHSFCEEVVSSLVEPHGWNSATRRESELWLSPSLLSALHGWTVK